MENFISENIFELINTQLEDDIIKYIIGINIPKGFMLPMFDEILSIKIFD